MELYLKDFFSFVNIGLILYLLTVGQEKEEKVVRKLTASKILCLLFFLGIRLFQNWLGTHIFWVYVTVCVGSIVLGHVWERHSVRYSSLIAGEFISIVSLGWVIGDVFLFVPSMRSYIDIYERESQTEILVIMEAAIIIGSICNSRIIKKMPLKISGKSFFAIMVSLFVNIFFLNLIGDNLYYNNTILFYNPEGGEYYSILIIATIFIISFVMVIGTSISFSLSESYLNVKYIEKEKNLRLTELNLQCDYYTRLERDMEQVKRLSHDIRNHLEVLKGSSDEARKQEYIEGIENHLKRFESYYKTGNTFIDNLLQNKKEEATEQNIQFKVLADLRPFYSIKDEDLCVMIANALDNALRECTLCQGEEPTAECLIQLKAGKVREFLSIVCENSIRDGQAVKFMADEEIQTTKEDPEYHGYGIKNIENAVHKYDGEMSITVRDRMFCLSIMIPL